MIMPAQYEDSMKDLNNLEILSPKTKIKAINDTVDILKQFGYDCGADIFRELMVKRINNNGAE